CPVVDTVLVPTGVSRSLPCPYHRKIRVDPARAFRVEAGTPGEEIAWFPLPPAMEHYYMPTDPTYRPLPSWKDPAIAASGDPPMEMIYPENGSQILLSNDMEASAGHAGLQGGD